MLTCMYIHLLVDFLEFHGAYDNDNKLACNVEHMYM